MILILNMLKIIIQQTGMLHILLIHLKHCGIMFGKHTLNKLNQMSDIDRALHNAGWLDSYEVDGYQNMMSDNIDSFDSSIHQSDEWKLILSQKKNDIIQK